MGHNPPVPRKDRHCKCGVPAIRNPQSATPLIDDLVNIQHPPNYLLELLLIDRALLAIENPRSGRISFLHESTTPHRRLPPRRHFHHSPGHLAGRLLDRHTPRI